MASAGTTRWGSSVAPGDCRSAYRSHDEPVSDEADVGFRLVCLPRSLSLTPTQLAEVCAANPVSALELDADASLIEMTPSGGISNARNSALVFQLQSWTRSSVE